MYRSLSLGFSTHTLGVKSNCKLKYIRGISCEQFTVEVVPALAKMTLFSMPKTLMQSSLGEPGLIVANSSLTLFAGER